MATRTLRVAMEASPDASAQPAPDPLDPGDPAGGGLPLHERRPPHARAGAARAQSGPRQLLALAAAHVGLAWSADTAATLADASSTSISTRRRPADGSSVRCARSRPASMSTWKSRSPNSAQAAMAIVRGAQAQASRPRRCRTRSPAGLPQAAQGARPRASSSASSRPGSTAAGGCSMASCIRRSARAGTTAKRTAADSCSTCIRTGATC